MKTLLAILLLCLPAAAQPFGPIGPGGPTWLAQLTPQSSAAVVSPSSLTTNLYWYLRLDETVDGQARTSVVNSVVFRDTGTVRSGTNGIITNAAWQFSATDTGRYLSHTNSAYSVYISNFSIVTWCYFAPSNLTTTAWTIADATHSDIAFLQGNTARNIVRNYQVADTSVSVASSAFGANGYYNQWYMFTQTMSNDVARFYSNVVLKSSTSLDSAGGIMSPAGASSSLRLFGDYGAGGVPVNRIDETGFWTNKVLSPTDITNLWNAGAGLTYPFTGAP